MVKNYVLDTNVLAHHPESIYSFQEHNVYIPEGVIEELDNLKKDKGELGYNVRKVINYLDKIRGEGKNFLEGIDLESGGKLFILPNVTTSTLSIMRSSWDSKKIDNQIIESTLYLKENSENETILVSKDTIIRIKSDMHELKSEDYQNDMVEELDKQYTGRMTVYIDSEDLDSFFENGELSLVNEDNELITMYNEQSELINSLQTFTENQYITLLAISPQGKSALGFYTDGFFKKLVFENAHPFGITGKNSGQIFAIDALLHSAETNPLVILKGPAGTAKTFLTIASGLHRVMDKEEKEYRKILVARPNILMDEDLGYLPGSEQEKIMPLMRPIFDNLEGIVDSDKSRYDNEDQLNDKINEIFDRGLIQFEAMGYFRGRSIVKQFIFIDEAQNITPKTMKGILSRAGEGTKIVIAGDPQQVDHPYLNETVNGLSYASEKMKGSSYCKQVTFTSDECQRSELAQEVSERL
ncbi:PhoH family protein [Bacillus phage vB_BpuM-BpSp]|nr:PhoH family protein [Bacillus phage vB_BpuM-BpSp]